jgi:hypothetical protein
MTIDMAIAGTANMNAKKNARADFLLCKVTDWPSAKSEAE